MLQIPALSLQYVRVRVGSRQAGTAVDLDGYTVQLAFTAVDVAPVSGDWKTGSWDTDTTTNPDTYHARCLVGPAGAVTLTAGTYAVYVKVTATPEIPVLRAGLMEVV